MNNIVKLEPKKKIKLKKYELQFTLEDGFKCKMTLLEQVTSGINIINGYLVKSGNNFDYMKFSNDLTENNYAEFPDDIALEIDHRIHEVTGAHVLKIIQSNDIINCDDGVILNLRALKRFKYNLVQVEDYEKEVDIYSIHKKGKHE